MGICADTGGMSFRIWCEHAWLGGPSATDGVLLDIDGDRFSSVELGVPTAPEGCARLDGLTLPGFVNPHFSVLNRPLRGRDQHAHAVMRSAISANITPELLSDLATATYSEMAIAGYTIVGEFLALHHRPGGSRYDDPNEIAAILIDAASHAGIRLGIIDVCSLGLPSRTTEQTTHRWVDRVDPLAERLRGKPTVRIIAGVDDITTLGDRGLGEVSLWAGQSGLPLHVRTSGTRPDGSSVFTTVQQAGALNNRGGFVAIGMNGTTEADAEALGQQRGYVVIDGSTDETSFFFGMLRMAGGRVAASLSGPTVPNPFAAIAAVAQVAASDPKCAALGTTELLRTVTVDAASCLGWRDAGLIAAGQLADLVTINLTTPRLAGLDHDDLLGSVVQSASPSDISHVAVGGRLIVNDGQHVGVRVGPDLDLAIRRVLREV